MTERMLVKMRKIDIKTTEAEIQPNAFEDDDDLIKLKQIILNLPQPEKNIILARIDATSNRDVARLLNINFNSINKIIQIIRNKIKRAYYDSI